MGREIEVKVPLTQNQFDELFNCLCLRKQTIPGVQVVQTSDKLIIKRDEYFSRYNTREERRANKEPQVIRIRTEEKDGKSEAYFTLKYKTRENGIELNREDETFVQDATVLREFFAEAGYHLFFEKIKKNYAADCIADAFPGITYHVELENINGLLYAEVEVVQEEGDAQKIKQSLFDFIKLLGLDPEKRDIRSWMEILLEKAGK